MECGLVMPGMTAAIKKPHACEDMRPKITTIV